MRSEISSADLIAAEDTRRFMGLASRLSLTYTGQLISLFDHNEQAKAGEIADRIEAGERVVVLTDAGMPAVSDPGYHVVKEVASRNLPVTAVPGPSAVLTAVAISGLPSDRFTFEGFVPRKAGERGRLLTELAQEKRTMVFFESPHRILATLEDFITHFGADRPMTLSRELTKTYEETLRGTTQSIHAEVADRDGLKGELTLVVAGAREVRTTSAKDLTDEVAKLVESGMRAKDAAAHIAKTHGLKSREVYEEYIHRK